MIFVRIWEGLGNQLFQYAYARALSMRTKQTVFLDARNTGTLACDAGRSLRKYELDNFRVKLPVCQNTEHFYPFLKTDFWDFMKNETLQPFFLYKYYEEPDAIYRKNLKTVTGHWYLQGWFQDVRYFEEYTDIIRQELLPKRKIKLRKELKQVLQKNNTVSVHIRRSDYKKVSNVLPITYYYNAMRHMQEMLDNPFWIVFSDDVEWCKENIDFGKNVYFISKKEKLQDYEEMLVMSSCRNHIIANSTFSWWGAWLNKRNEKIVIGPNQWVVKGFYKNEVEILLKNWIKEPVL